MKGKKTDVNEVATLVRKAKEGDDDAFSALCEQYRPLLWSAVRSFSEGEPAEDMSELISEAEFALYRAVVTYRTEMEGVTFGFYARTCVRNALISLVRKRGRRVALCSLDEAEWASIPVYDDPSVRMIADELYAEVCEILSPYERRVFDLHVMEGESISTVAQKVGKSEKSVSNAVFRMLQKLRREL